MNAMHVQDVFIFNNFLNSLSPGLGLLAIYLLFVEKIRPVSDCLLKFLTVSISCSPTCRAWNAVIWNIAVS